MKCNEIDMMEYIEGRVLVESGLHIKSCRRCSAEAAKLINLSQLISTRYAQGKKLEKDVQDKLALIEIPKMKKLPDAIAKKVAELKKKNLTARLKKLVRSGEEKTKTFLEDLMSPQLHAMPASPKDITRTKRTKKKKNK